MGSPVQKEHLADFERPVGGVDRDDDRVDPGVREEARSFELDELRIGRSSVRSPSGAARAESATVLGPCQRGTVGGAGDETLELGPNGGFAAGEGLADRVGQGGPLWQRAGSEPDLPHPVRIHPG